MKIHSCGIKMLKENQKCKRRVIKKRKGKGRERAAHILEMNCW